jgi:hypothetical protein
VIHRDQTPPCVPCGRHIAVCRSRSASGFGISGFCSSPLKNPVAPASLQSGPGGFLTASWRPASQIFGDIATRAGLEPITWRWIFLTNDMRQTQRNPGRYPASRRRRRHICRSSYLLRFDQQWRRGDAPCRRSGPRKKSIVGIDGRPECDRYQRSSGSWRLNLSHLF